ncbi:LacI family DNA-binding transcriptional regulator [Pseudogemmobacter faecipullorum]|uniref:LacI family DNA-binding transcriptional regulator n=1 Tax=Pseudogemmobacter faecipullorum TaxID=2755041 RepID=A0ABS8CPR4_9RHOB|nr:LacI family DNA-binding transcriptional regulator [Pseudogemmobacter faecipullorum]MCB5411359.1 LacI family DNA-binding transcriptional regulator [Pseudogemmobacter faecipullorum]
MDKRPTIIDVAREAGVSKSTVSLVLQNSPLVRDQTREEVRRAMAELGYVYNRSAANLRQSNAGLVGLVINDLRNPFFTEFATSAQMALSARGYATVLANTDEDPALQTQVMAAMLEHGVSALIVSPAYGNEDETFGAIARAGIPTLQVLRKASPDTETFPFAAPDYALGSRLATEQLVQAGARHIAFLGGLEGRGVTDLRMAGYREVLAQAGLKPLILPGRPTRSWGREAMIRLAEQHPETDAALCFNDLVALGVSSGMARLGRAPGPDFRLTGFDDIEESAEAWPALSSVRCDIAGFGRRMAGTLLRWLEEGIRPAPETLTPVELIVRASSR